MRKARLVVILAGLFVLLSAGASAAGGPWKVASWQFGVPTTDVQAGNEFEIRGSGFHAAVLPVKVCISGSFCQLAEVGRDGQFVVTRTLGTAGDYQVTAFQAKDMNISEWRLRATAHVTVRN